MIPTRRSCGIELGEIILVTGGYINGATSDQVTGYSRSGDYYDLGYLTKSRDNHACTKYMNHQGNHVRQSIFYTHNLCHGHKIGGINDFPLCIKLLQLHVTLNRFSWLLEVSIPPTTIWPLQRYQLTKALPGMSWPQQRYPRQGLVLGRSQSTIEFLFLVFIFTTCDTHHDALYPRRLGASQHQQCRGVWSFEPNDDYLGEDGNQKTPPLSFSHKRWGFLLALG